MKNREVQEARDLAEECEASLFKRVRGPACQVRLGIFDKIIFESSGEAVLDLSSNSDATFCLEARQTILNLVQEIEELRGKRLEKAVRAVWSLHEDGDELDPDEFEAALRGALFPED